MREVLFRTVHGSHLYGLNNEESDEDFYTVVTKKPVPPNRQVRARYAKQTINDGLDTTVVDFGTWVEMCRKGVPQALEAMFSTMPLGDDRIADFRASFRVGTEVYGRYFDTIKSFAMADTYKRRRHSLRLALNLNELARTGRFNPTLSEAQAEYVSALAHRSGEEVYDIAKCIAW